MRNTYDRARRANASGGLTQIAGNLGLVTAFFFWAWVDWDFIRPTESPSLIATGFLGLFVLFLAGCMAIVQPALVAATLPNTAAAMYLQKLRRETWGFWSIGTSVLILMCFSVYILFFWWSARLAISMPDIAETPTAPILTFGFTLVTLIFFVIVPAWATNYGTPVLWLVEVQQAQQVKKLEIQQTSELIILKNRLLLAEQRAAVSYANLLPGEQEETRQILQGLFMGIADSQRAIARCMGVTADTERAMGILDDESIIDEMSYVAQLLEQPARQLEAGITCANKEPRSPPEAAGRVASETGGSGADMAGERPRTLPPPRPAAPRRAPPRYAAEYDLARRCPVLTGAWGAADLGRTLGKSERTARDWLKVWEEAGLAARGDTRNTWYFTEDREA